jgi:hypothetical protein
MGCINSLLELKKCVSGEVVQVKVRVTENKGRKVKVHIFRVMVVKPINKFGYLISRGYSSDGGRIYILDINFLLLSRVI